MPIVFVQKNTNPKDQITNKFQIPMIKYQNFPGQNISEFLNFGHWIFFEIWKLIFGILISK
ncbi:hypothetical protein KKA69_04960 [Patescibacteria group bacterium]|nr:hypothetical protein [Patescibacteria group bacterium]